MPKDTTSYLGMHSPKGATRLCRDHPCGQASSAGGRWLFEFFMQCMGCRLIPSCLPVMYRLPQLHMAILLATVLRRLLPSNCDGSCSLLAPQFKIDMPDLQTDAESAATDTIHWLRSCNACVILGSGSVSAFLPHCSLAIYSAMGHVLYLHFESRCSLLTT